MKPTASQIREFLNEVDTSFPTPLSKKQNLADFADKLFEKATLCCAWNENEIAAMVAGYTDNLTGNIAYISVVATQEKCRGKGGASKLVKEFIDICRQKEIESVHLYTSKSNENAIRLYKRLGFELWHLQDEPRPDDVHMIYYIRKNLDCK